MADPTPSATHCANHPETPALGACQHCGTFSCGQCLGMLGGRRICATCVRERRVTVYGVPWERRNEIGRLKAWWQTVWGTWANPVSFYARTDPAGSVLEAMGFAAVTWLLLLALWVGFMGLIGGLIAAAMAFEGNVGAEEVLIVVVVMVVYAVLIPGFVGLWGFVMPLIHHLVLLVVGGGGGGLRATYRAGMYSFGVVILQGIPCLNYVAWIWIGIVQGIGYSYIHRTDGWRSAVAIVVPYLICCACCLAYYVVLIAAVGI